VAAAGDVPDRSDRLECFDLSTLNGGLGSELRLANVAFYELRLARDREKAIDAARRALASGRLGENGSASFHFGVYTLLGAGLFDEAMAAYDRALDDAQRRGDPPRLSACLVFRGRCRTLRGELIAALGDLREGFDMICEHRVQALLGYATGLLALAQLEHGDLDGAAKTIEASGFPEKLPSRIVINFFQIARGRLRIETGEVERGVGDLLAVGRRCLEIPSDNPASYAWRRFAVDGLLMLGRNDEARRLAEEELAIARRWGARHEIGASLRGLGLVAGGEEGERLLMEAVEPLDGTGARLQHARALLDLGAAQRRAGRRTAARERLRAAADLALSGGALALAERANEELAALGSRPRKVLQSGLDALTPSERRVAEMAAGELSNREIAQALFVTVKTVELHLSSAYRKLALGSRRELAAALAVSA
jgi:DNA-binding CsgD family transcriptional regulator